MERSKFEWLLKRPIAHRGLHNDTIMENTLAAYDAAAKAGYGIEIDVRLLRDGNIAVFHDPDLKRVCGVKKRVRTLTKAELDTFPTKNGDRIPMLQDVLDTVDGRVPILIEFKSIFPIRLHTMEKKVLKILESYKGRDTVALQSFNVTLLWWLQRHKVPYPVGQLYSVFMGIKIKFIKGVVKYIGLRRPDFISYDITKVPKPAPEVKQNHFKPVICWTVKTLKELDLSKKYADNIIFEYTDPSTFNA